MMGIDHSKCAYWAIIDGRQSDLQFHISNGAKLTRTNATTGRSVMHLACERGNTRTVELVNQCTHGRFLNHMDKDENTPLNIAIYWNHSNVVSTLLKLGADPNYGHTLPLRFHRMPIHVASTKRSGHILHEILRHGSEVNTRDSWGCTPLMIAINSKSTECAELLLHYGADTELRDYYYESTSLQIAIHSKVYDVICLLLDYGADTNATETLTFATPLVQAAELGVMPLVRLLLEYGARPSLLARYADRSQVAELIEEYSQPRALLSLCRIVLRRKYKSDLPRIAKLLSKRMGECLMYQFFTNESYSVS
eukprot:TRINITY_DN5543_c0_g3_i10.p1 TRINITY_DN5543_c0_g3~~TRINITY_DN5543_c0_g3_i10.p1  ORF type:complete len:309 (-),score=26.86 TRINITY_DN5543_c0_g3_i10:87-1013(-)